MAVVPELAFGAEELGELVAVLDDWGVVTLAEGLWPVGVAPLAAVAPKEKEVTVVVPPRQLDEGPTTTVTKPEISVLPVLSRTENCS